MDAQAFDRWVKTVSRRPTRRVALRLLAGGFVGGLLFPSRSVPAHAAQVVVGPPSNDFILTCAAQGLTDCGYCTDTASDPSNCGGCGIACGPGSSCLNAACLGLVEAPPAGVSLVDCAAQGLTDCGGFCANLAADSANCGACGNSCPLGGYCQGGLCTGLYCPDGLADCGVGYCVDLNSDANHCGGCQLGCFVGYECVNGACV
jgi:hypothetical protein